MSGVHKSLVTIICYLQVLGPLCATLLNHARSYPQVHTLEVIFFALLDTAYFGASFLVNRASLSL